MRQAGTGLANTVIGTLVIMRQDRWDNRRIRQIAGICVNFGGMEHKASRILRHEVGPKLIRDQPRQDH
jgi:hypothetical protein